MITNSDLTIYNKYLNKETERTEYIRTYIYGVNFQVKNMVSIADKGLNSANVATVFIPMNADFSNKKYKKPKAFKNISSLSKDDFFTFEEGDIIVKGICDFELSSKNLNELKNNFDDVYSLISIETNENGSEHMHHWKIGAK